MKIRKSAVVLIVAVLLLAAAFIYFDTNLLDHIKRTSQEDAVTESDIGGSRQGQAETEQQYARPEEATAEPPAAGESSDTDDTLIASEDVPVSYNTPEYDISVQLCESSDQKTYIRLRYYSGGASTVNELDEEQIPELSGIFESRGGIGRDKNKQKKDAANQGTDDAKKGDQEDQNRPYSIGQALLNPVYGQLYLQINGAPVNGYIQTSLYMADLNDMSVKKLFSYPARYGRMLFNRDFSMLAYSFSDPPQMNTYKEDELVEVYDCVNGEFLVKGSRKAGESVIGSNSDPDMIYDYTLDNWQSLSVIRLSQAARPKDNPKAEPVKTLVCYDIKQDLLLDANGNVISPENGDQSGADGTAAGNEDAAESGQINKDGDSGQEAGPGTAESEPVKLLKEFYSCLGSESQYSRAMQMLDDGFILRLGMLRQFGIEEIYKSDIDLQYNENNVKIYADLFRTAKFDELVSESADESNTVSIKYYQTLGLSPETQTRQLMTAKLAKRDEGWVITLIEDGT